jgi:hypothetical protein
MINISQTIPLDQIDHFQNSTHGYQRATMLTSPQHALSVADQSHDEQVTQFIERHPERERGTLVVPQEEQIAKIHEDVPVFEFLRNSHPSMPSISSVNEIQSDHEGSLHTHQINEQPIVFHASRIHQLDQSDEQELGEQSVTFREELMVKRLLKIDDAYALLRQNIAEQLPEIERTTVQMEYSYVASFIQLPANHVGPVSIQETRIVWSLLFQSPMAAYLLASATHISF